MELLTDYQEEKSRVLSENDLIEIAARFRDLPERSFHLNRHVFPPRFEREERSLSKTRMGIILGLDLLNAWSTSKAAVAKSMFTSEPCLIVETDWVRGRRNAAPPYVYMCLAKDSSAFQPVHSEDAKAKVVAKILDLEPKGVRSEFVESEDPDALDGDGAWTFWLETNDRPK